MTLDLGSPYFVLLAIGFALGFVYFIRVGTRLGIERVATVDVCIAAIVGGMLGGRLLHVVAEPLPAYELNEAERGKLAGQAATLDPTGKAAVEAALASSPVAASWSFIARMPPGSARDEAIALARTDPGAVPASLWYRAKPLEVVQFWKGGLAYFGGLVLAVAVCFVVARRHGIDVRTGLDVAAPAIILGLIFGRLGCFAGGCCYGEVCDPAWWAAQPGWYGPEAGGAHRYPTALLSSAFAAALFGGLHLLLKKRAFSGEVFLAMVVLYAPGRFVIEALRDDPRGGIGALSTTQIAVLVTGVPALIAWVVLRMRGAGDPAPIAGDPASTEGS